MRERTSFKVGIVAIALLVVVAAFFIPNPEGLAFEGKMMLGILAACILLWITEAIPIVITAWLFAAAVPIMGILSPNETWAQGVSVAMVLCLSCFAFALFVQYSSISLRIIAFVLKWARNDSKKALAGLMAATAILSMIIDDLVLVLMMLPFAYKILDENGTPWGDKSNLAKALVLGIAFASYIGGWITPVGSVVNILAMGFAEQALGVTVTFANWMILGLIMNIVILPVSWLVLVKVFKADQRRCPCSHTGRARRPSRLHQRRGVGHAHHPCDVGPLARRFVGSRLGRGGRRSGCLGTALSSPVQMRLLPEVR